MLTGAVDYSTIVTSDTTFAWQSATIRRLAKEGPCVIIEIRKAEKATE